MVFRSDRDDWVQSMAMAGIGFTFIPEFAVTMPGLRVRPLIEPEIVRTIQVVTVRGRPHAPAVGAFVREILAFSWANAGSPELRALPAHAQAGGERMVVGAAGDLAVVAQVDRGRAAMWCVAEKPTTAALRSGVAPNTVKELAGAPAKAAVIGRAVSANSCSQPSRSARSSLRSLPQADRRRGEVGADRGALRVGGLLRHVEAERAARPTR